MWWGVSCVLWGMRVCVVGGECVWWGMRVCVVGGEGVCGGG